MPPRQTSRCAATRSRPAQSWNGDKAGYACAVGWAETYCVTAYVGNVNFTRPIRPGALIEVTARIVHTGRTTMHIIATVTRSDVRERSYSPALDCLLVFVAMHDGEPAAVTPWTPSNSAEAITQTAARSRIEPRRAIQRAMAVQVFSEAGTVPRTVLRFLASPADANWAGNAHGGTVMRWIDEAAYACAASWSSTAAVAIYAGGINFHRPIHIGDLIEVDARLIHTGPHSMHINVHVRAAPADDPGSLSIAARCLTIFVDIRDGRAGDIPPVPLLSADDRAHSLHALSLATMRKQLEPLTG